MIVSGSIISGSGTTITQHTGGYYVGGGVGLTPNTYWSNLTYSDNKIPKGEFDEHDLLVWLWGLLSSSDRISENQEQLIRKMVNRAFNKKYNFEDEE
jgi:hypothetical protein